MYGYNRENQKTSPSQLNSRNLRSDQATSNKCEYISPNSWAYFGYVVVDNDNNGYATDVSGDIFKFNLDSCEEIWRTNIAATLGFENGGQIISRNSPTLYDNYVLIGAPNGRFSEYPNPTTMYPFTASCFAIAFDQDDGSFVYKIDLNNFDLDGDGMNDESPLQSLGCHAHGFIVDTKHKYAYGGMSSAANVLPIPNAPHAFQGRVYKINLMTRQIENVFYTFPDNQGQTTDRYSGASSWNFPALIDDYLVFGSAQLYSYPDRILDCLQDPALIPIANNYPFNPCGDDRSDNKFWRCLENDVYLDSLIALNVNDFSIKSITRTMGVDGWALDCIFPNISQRVDCPIVDGPDADVTAIATYKRTSDGSNDIIAVTTTKASQFLVVNIETGQVLISKQTGLDSPGNAVWSTAIDPDQEIAISSYTGFNVAVARYELPNGDIICNTGLASAIDLKTGKTKWIFVVPYGRIVSRDGPDVCSDAGFGSGFGIWFDRAEHGRCTIDPGGNRFINDSEAKIIIPPISDRLPINSINRARIWGPITISNGLVYIPTETGDVYVLKLENGKFVARFECPEVQLDGQYNRAGIQSGVTVIEKRIIFYCGANITEETHGNIVVSINFDPDGSYASSGGSGSANAVPFKLSNDNDGNDNNISMPWLLYIFGAVIIITTSIAFNYCLFHVFRNSKKSVDGSV